MQCKGQVPPRRLTIGHEFSGQKATFAARGNSFSLTDPSMPLQSSHEPLEVTPFPQVNGPDFEREGAHKDLVRWARAILVECSDSGSQYGGARGLFSVAFQESEEGGLGQIRCIQRITWQKSTRPLRPSSLYLSIPQNSMTRFMKKCDEYGTIGRGLTWQVFSLGRVCSLYTKAPKVCEHLHTL